MKIFYKLASGRLDNAFRMLFLSLLLLSGVVANSQVTVSGAVVGNGAYATLGDAFTALNGAAQPAAVISISLSGNTTELASAILNTGTWTSVTINATVPVVVTGSITGAIIKLNGADAVIIDGRIGGVGNNITVSNTMNAAATAAVWISSTGVGAGANNNIIRNLNLSCGTDVTAVTSATFGVIISGTAVSATSAGGDDNDGNRVIACSITKCRYGIVTRGVGATNLNQNTIISDNIIGSAAFDGNRVSKAGIYCQFENNCTITRNTIRNIAVLTSDAVGGSDRIGIGLGGESWSNTPSNSTSTNFIVTRNTITNIIDEKTFSAVGIAMSTTNGGVATNNLVANNCIANVRSNGTAGDASTGIGISGGHTDIIVFNSITMLGDLDPGTAASTSQTNTCLRVVGTPTNPTIRNNAFYMDATSNTVTLFPACIQIPTAAFAFGTGVLNNNDYYIPVTNTQARTGAIGTASLATSFFVTLADWQAALAPVQDAASVAVDPNFVDPLSNLHNNSIAFNLNALAVPIAGVSVDIDNDTRNAVTPDIGCDEFSPVTCASADGGSITPGTTTICNSGSTTLTASGFSFGQNSTYEWESSPDGSTWGGTGDTSPSTYLTGTINSTTHYRLRSECSTDGSTDYSNVIIINVYSAAAAVTATDTQLCAGESADISENGGTALSWLWSNGSTDQQITVSPSSNTTYSVTTTSGGGCTANASVQIIVNALPIVSSGVDDNEVCPGDIVNLTSAAAVGTLPSEDFNGAMAGWTTTNLSTGGTPANAAWALHMSPYLYSSINYISNDASQFIMANSDAQGSGSTTNVNLYSPIFSTAGYTSMNLSYYHYFKDIGAGDSAEVRISTNGGLNWTTVQAHTANQGAAATWVQTNVNLDAYAGFSSVQLRFFYYGTWDWYWAIDNVVMSGTAGSPSYAWSSDPSGFASSDQNPMGVVVTETTDYTVDVTDANGCVGTSTVSVTALVAGCTDSQAVNYNMLAVCEDGSCTYAAGENPVNAIPASVAMNPACAGNSNDITGYGASGAAQSAAVTGEDVWYEYTASTTGVRIDVISSAFDVLIELQSAGGTMLDAENVKVGLGDEYMNVQGLTPGNLYRIGVRNYDSGLGAGMFTLCIRELGGSTCDYGPGPYSLCNTFKADWVGAYTYIFNYTETTAPFATFIKNNGSSTFCVLSTVPGLHFDETYDVRIDVQYTLVDGNGLSETITTLGSPVCPITLSAQPLAILRPSDNCINHAPHFLGNYIAAQPFVCGAINWKWEFTRTDMPELPIEHYRGSSNRFLRLVDVPGLASGASYDVRIAPVFGYGDGDYGTTDCIQIVGLGGMVLDPNDQVKHDQVFDKDVANMIDVALYPNPNNGEMVNLNIVDMQQGVVQIDMVDVYGKLVYSNQFVVEGSLNTLINFDRTLPSGLYMVNIYVNGELRTERFVVER